MTGSSFVGAIQRRSGLSQAELARRVGIPRSVMNVYLRGKREPGADTLLRIAAAGGFQVELSERRPPVDVDDAGRVLIQVLELAEALPFRPRAEVETPPLRERLRERAAA